MSKKTGPRYHTNTLSLENDEMNSILREELMALESVEGVVFLNGLCDETLRRINTTPLMCPNTFTSLLLQLDIEITTLQLSLIEMLFSSGICTVFCENHVSSLIQSIWTMQYVMTNVLEEQVLSEEHRKAVWVLTWYSGRICAIKGLDTLPFIDDVVNELISLVKTSLNCTDTIEEKGSYLWFEVSSVAKITAYTICSLAMMLASTAEFFARDVPVFSLLLKKWIQILFGMLNRYSMIPCIRERDIDLRCEVTWKYVIRLTRQYVESVMWDEEGEAFKEYALDCLDRLTAFTYFTLY